jgi:peptidoglycan/xylan/chitin deacetylase (PgdA/CDA1 family)
MKKFIRWFLVGIIAVLVVGVFYLAFWLRDCYVVPILTYHHVRENSDQATALNAVSTKSFEFQMAFLRRHGYHVISFNDLVEGIQKGYAFSHNTVVIQFDDGYKDNYTDAFPILKKNNFPAMVFLISDLVGAPGFLTWDQMKEMESSNFLAGAHTRHHPYLPKLSVDLAQDEIAGSKKIIEQHLGHPIDYLAYPAGGFTAEDKQIAKKAGFKAAATTNRAKDRWNHDLYELKRIRMNDKDNRFSGLILWGKLSGYYNLFRESKCGGKSADMIVK